MMQFTKDLFDIVWEKAKTIPGMDPYLEAPFIWPDFHGAFLSSMLEALQPVLPEPYHALLRGREEVGTGPAWLSEATERSTVSFLEVREAAEDGKLVLLVELLSPSNKVPGPDREALERRQAEVFASDVHWVEIDLLRVGRRLGGDPRVHLHCRSNAFDYVVVVSRSSRRSPDLGLEMYGFTVRDALPVVSLPLLAPDPDVPLDLGAVFRAAYLAGRFQEALRYDGPPPEPPLPEASAEWARSILGRRSGP